MPVYVDSYGDLRICCTICGADELIAANEKNKSLATDYVHTHGWRTYKEDGKFVHYCPDCLAEEQKRRRLKYFGSPEAQRKAEEEKRIAEWAAAVKLRDNGRCVICGSDKEVQAHHIIPKENDPEGKYRTMLSNGVTLCAKHHAMVHPWMEGKNREQTKTL